jgi:hypothetical protein
VITELRNTDIEEEHELKQLTVSGQNICFDICNVTQGIPEN